LQASLHLLLTGIVGVVVYKLIKHATGRQRPCNAHEDIFLAIDPLDYYSFPSGHTLHAVSFTIVVMHYYPEMGLICIPFSACVALSRVILGLHYPTDVLAGAAVGTALAAAGIQLT
jgi:undecaprenyl-diphosphatase